VLGLWDAFPVSPGHALLVPKRHVATWFDATKEEQAELVAAIDIARAAIDRRLHGQPDGYNIGVNVGRAAGQTVFHLHVHVIPRKSGDVPDPRGGVRHVIPSKGNYLLPASQASARASRLVRGGEDPLLPELIQGLAGAKRVDCAVAFVLASGVERLRHHLRDVVRREGRVRLLAGDYLDVTEPHALRLLLDLAVEPEANERLTLRVFESSRVGTGYHPKGYLLFGDDQGTVGSAYVGSSNLSRSALGENIEWNFRIDDEVGLASVRDGFDRLWTSDATAPLTAEWIEGYEGRRRKPRTAAVLAAALAAGPGCAARHPGGGERGGVGGARDRARQDVPGGLRLRELRASAVRRTPRRDLGAGVLDLPPRPPERAPRLLHRPGEEPGCGGRVCVRPDARPHSALGAVCAECVRLHRHRRVSSRVGTDVPQGH
jgi:diadenosine tetraphosphate (Ap4A) HIT family hydrolase/HKD family nuclease